VNNAVTSIYIYMVAKLAVDVNEGIENALNVIVSTTGSSGNMKKKLKNFIFYTVNNLKKLFAKLVDTNENNNRKIIVGKEGSKHNKGTMLRQEGRK